MTRRNENIPITRLNENIPMTPLHENSPLTRPTESSENEKGQVPENLYPESLSSEMSLKKSLSELSSKRKTMTCPTWRSKMTQ